MGVAADFETFPAERWQLLFSKIADVGIEICEECEFRGMKHATCRRGPARLSLALDPTEEVENLCLYGRAIDLWLQPFSTRRLCRDVLRIVRDIGHQP